MVQRESEVEEHPSPRVRYHDDDDYQVGSTEKGSDSDTSSSAIR